jgi:GH15 family glucan-1,4-alpha-glucosidase
MPRSLVLSNGYLSVCLDQSGIVRDVYYPHVGLENHVAGNKHRMGVMIDDQFSWLDSADWETAVHYLPATMVGDIHYHHRSWGIDITITDIVYNELPIFIRHIVIKNPDKRYKNIRMFFGQEFAIGESKFRNTAFYDPTKNCVVHYKGRRVFLVNGRSEVGGLDDYTIGMFNYAGREGSWRDAEDGELSKNAVEHGPADSVFRISANCADQTETHIDYWLCAAETIDDVYKLNEVVLRKTPAAILHSTSAYWKAWVESQSIDFLDLPESVRALYQHSLLILRAHVDHNGGVIASLDSDMLLYGKDSYAYVWPRDGAYNAMALDHAGYTSVTRPFFEVCRSVLHPDGYLHHKYQPDKSLGSTWHSTIRQKDWLENRILQLPIQEDEIATVLFALWNHYECSRDIEFIEDMYKPFIEKAANFLVAFRDRGTGLPIHSYDLWEEVTGVMTYTVCTVIGGLRAAAKFSRLLGKENHASTYEAVANDLRRALLGHLFDPELKSFVRVATIEGTTVKRQPLVDISSLFGLWYYDILDADDQQLIDTIAAVEQRLHLTHGIGGFIRYENDPYYRSPQQSFPNPWIITTLWEMQRRMKFTTTMADLEKIRPEFQWVSDRMGNASVLAEQYDPDTNEAKSATPLAWSHAVYIETVLLYLRRRRDLAGK